MTDNLDKEEIIFQSRFSKEEVREFFKKDTKFYHTMNTVSYTHLRAHET